jgi:putative transposase
MPTKVQEQKLAGHFGACRFVYNYFLAQRKDSYINSGKSPNYYEQAADLTKLKKEFDWLYDANSQVLQFELKCLEGAYNNFFAKRAKLPKFHSRKQKQSFTIPQFVEVDENKLYFPKFKEGIKVRLHREIEGKIKHASISLNCAGQYFVSILVERNIKQLKKVKKEIGIDLGITALATPSVGKAFKNIRPYKTLEKRLRVLNKDLHRKKLGSENREKARKKLARLHVKIANIRNDHLHKVSRKIINENQVICLETLNVSGMMKNRCLAKSIADVSLSELVRQIEYKAGWYGRTVIKVDRWFPSSKMCSCCNYVMESLPLDIRSWTCPKCSVKHNRDKNAAKNIYNEGKRTVGTTGIACGIGVRPKSNLRRLIVKQETPTL